MLEYLSLFSNNRLNYNLIKYPHTFRLPDSKSVLDLRFINFAACRIVASVRHTVLFNVIIIYVIRVIGKLQTKEIRDTRKSEH
jgi:hypothetical protein